MPSRVLLVSYEIGLGYNRGIYHFSKSLIRAIEKQHKLGLLTQAYKLESSEILTSLHEPSYHFRKKNKQHILWGYYLKHFFCLQKKFEFVQNSHSSSIDNYTDAIDFFVNKPAFYYYNNLYMQLPGLSLQNLENEYLSAEDVIFTTSPVSIKSGKHKVIQTLHDVFPLVNGDKYYQRTFHRKIHGLAMADKIMAVSNYAKDSFLTYYPNLENKIEVVYQAIAIDSVLIEQSKDALLNKIVLNKYDLKSKEYMFFVGAIEYRKNIHNLVQAYKIATQGSRELKLIIAGRADDPDYLKKFDLLRYSLEGGSENIQFIGEISNLEKVCLIKNSRAFLFPSLLEGFGIPVVEAQTLGIPVLTSNNSALTEVAADSAFLVENPEDLEELANSIQQLWNDDELCRDLSRKGLENIKRFAFDTFSDNVNRIIDSV